MLWLTIPLGVVAFVLTTAAVCYFITFYNPPTKKSAMEEDLFPPGKVYEPFHPQMRIWLQELRQMQYEPLSAVAEDGVTLRGKYYEYAPGAPIELMFHGYRGMAERDLCGGVQRCFALGHSALIVDQRASGTSGGRTITFGARERKDVHTWLKVMAERFGPDARIILCGVSMGATTVLLAAGDDLPETVVGVLSDCGYTSAKAIICKVIRQLHLPAPLLYPFVRLGAVLYGRFDPNKVDTVPGMRRCKVPVIFFHGEDDDFVPYQMSVENHAACAADKQLVIAPGAGHCLCFSVDQEGYLNTLREFEEKYWKK